MGASSATGIPPSGSAPSETTTIGAYWLSNRGLDVAADALEIERLLRDQDHVGAAREARVERDPPRVAAHHLDDQRPLVALRGRVEAVDRAHRDVDRGVEAERVVGGAEVVVDRLRHPDDVDPGLVQPPGGAERVLAADRDQPVDARLLEVRGDPLGPPSSLNGFVREEPRIVPPRGRMPRTSGIPSGLRVALERAAPAVAKADELMPVLADALAHDRADHGVQPGAIAAARENSESHAPNIAAPRFRLESGAKPLEHRPRPAVEDAVEEDEEEDDRGRPCRRARRRSRRSSRSARRR